MYALLVKNGQDTWDVWSKIDDIPVPVRKERIETALASGLPITGMILTPYKWSANSGATFDGTGFTGGSPSPVPLDNDWSGLNTFGYLCDNVIVGAFVATAGTLLADQYNAIFESETTIIKVPEGQTAVVGDIWDGTNIINK